MSRGRGTGHHHQTWHKRPACQHTHHHSASDHIPCAAVICPCCISLVLVLFSSRACVLSVVPCRFVDNYLRMVHACAQRDRQRVVDMSVALGFLTGKERRQRCLYLLHVPQTNMSTCHHIVQHILQGDALGSCRVLHCSCVCDKSASSVLDLLMVWCFARVQWGSCRVAPCCTLHGSYQLLLGLSCQVGQWP